MRVVRCLINSFAIGTLFFSRAHSNERLNTVLFDYLNYLANALKQSSTIQSLHLRCCSISDSVIQILAAVLSEKKGLEFLALVGNPVGQDGTKSFLAGLKKKVHLNGVRLPVKYYNNDDIEYYLALKRGGRCLLHQCSYFPLAACLGAFESICRTALPSRRSFSAFSTTSFLDRQRYVLWSGT